MIAKTLEKELNLEQWQVNKVIKLIDEGNTIPFIARYSMKGLNILETWKIKKPKS